VAQGAQAGSYRLTCSLRTLRACRRSSGLQVLESAGYIVIEKTFEDRRPRTWIALTKAGRDAFAGEVAALRALLDRVAPRGRR
jgi:hypothetical protein